MINTTPAMIRHGFFATTGTTTRRSNIQEAATAAAELLNLGFVAAIADLNFLTTSQLHALITAAKTTIGTDRHWQPLFPGFPQEVLTATDLELFITTMRHYYTEGAWRPPHHPPVVMPLPDIDWASNRRSLRPQILSPVFLQRHWAQSIAMSAAEQELSRDIAHALHPEANLLHLFGHTQFRNGENYATAIQTLTDTNYHAAEILSVALHKARNVDDILRCILALYCRTPQRAHDLTHPLRHHIPMRNIPRPARREILAVLARFDDDLSLDLGLRRVKLWRAVLNRIHPFELSTSVGAERFLDVIYGNTYHQTFNSKVEAALTRKDPVTAANLLVHQPGNLARRLQHLLILAGSDDAKGWQQAAQAIEYALMEAGTKVRLTTLISAYNGLKIRDLKHRIRRLKLRNHFHLTVPNERINPGLLAQILEALENAILARLTLAPAPTTTPLPCGSLVPVELARRWASSSVSNLWPGEHLPLGPLNENAVLRLFVHWYGQDVDLGVVFSDAELTQCLAYLDYTNHTTSRLRKSLVHSGDVVHAAPPAGGCEFIDLRLATQDPHRKTLTTQIPEARYAIVHVASFSGEHFRFIDNIAGVMLRSDDTAGAVFEPRTVETASAIQVSATSAIPFVIDLETTELIWLDSSTGKQFGKFNLSNSVEEVGVAQAEMAALAQQLTCGQLLSLWAQAHGVPTTDEAAGAQAKDWVKMLLDHC